MKRSPAELKKLLNKIDSVHARASDVHENELPLGAKILAGIKSSFREIFGMDTEINTGMNHHTSMIANKKMRM